MVWIEEECFYEIINEGLSMLNEVIKEVKDVKGDILDGKIIFKFYDIFGFFVELMEEVVEDEGLKVDYVGFEIEMEV